MATQKQKHPVKEHGFRNLLFFLLLYIVGSPFLVPYPSLAVLAHLSLSVALFAAVYAVSREKNQRSVAISLLLPLLLLYWLGIYDIISFSRVGAYLLFTVYYGLLVYLFVSQIRNAKRVSANVLYATFSLYLIIGLFWGSLYSLVYQFSPGAYGGVLLENTQNVNHTFNYFSFVTLTTLGYGDITPQIPGAASLCQMEAIVGQFFTAVVVAWLMGMYLFDSKNQKQDQ
jgi:voltage-gated potassium channel